MDGTRLQGLIYCGYGKTAQHIGLPHDQYRPAGPINPIDPANKIATLPAHFRVDDALTAPNGYGKATWRGWFDARTCQAGDYLSGAAGTYFIAALQPLLPPLAVQCNRTITITRPAPPPGFGGLDYNANGGPDMVLAAGCPASLLLGGKGVRNEVGLPADVKTPEWMMLLPAFAGLALRGADAVTDDMGTRYIISGAELSDLGWRVTAQAAVT